MTEMKTCNKKGCGLLQDNGSKSLLQDEKLLDHENQRGFIYSKVNLKTYEMRIWIAFDQNCHYFFEFPYRASISICITPCIIFIKHELISPSMVQSRQSIIGRRQGKHP
jgi:hypothetical protein